MYKRSLSVAALTAGALAFPATAFADGEDRPSVSHERIDDCVVELEFTNPTDHFFGFDYRVDGEEGDGVEEDLRDLEIEEGPLAGEPFPERYRTVDLEPGDSHTETLTPEDFDSQADEHTVEYWLARGAEQNRYLPPETVTVEDCEPDESEEEDEADEGEGTDEGSEEESGTGDDENGDGGAEHPLGITATAEKCGRLELTFRNDTDWFYSFDYRVDGQAPTETDEHADGERYNPVDVDGGEGVHEVTETVTVEDGTGEHEVAYRVARGAESDLYDPREWRSTTVTACEGDDSGGDGAPENDGTDTGGTGDERPAPENGNASGGEGSLPVTGAALTGLLAAGALALGGGAGTWYLSRERRAARRE